MKRSVRSPIGLLFKPDELPAAAHGGGGDVTLAMEVVAETDKAWLLKPSGERGSGNAKWLPKSQARRGVGTAERQFTMARHAAHHRGWL